MMKNCFDAINRSVTCKCIKIVKIAEFDEELLSFAVNE